MSERVEERLDEEFRLIKRYRLAGSLLLYREIVLLAQQIMEEKGMAHPEIPLEERPPGRGRGSSVALLVGYLIGISHVDPAQVEPDPWSDSSPRTRPNYPTSIWTSPVG